MSSSATSSRPPQSPPKGTPAETTDGDAPDAVPGAPAIGAPQGSDRLPADELRGIVGTLYTTPSKQLPVQRLPQLIKKLEKDKGVHILTEDELQSLEAFAGGAQGLMLAEDEMVALLVQMMPSSQAASTNSSSPADPSSALPPIDSPLASRRSSSSSRIRSASDSDSSSSSDASTDARLATVRADPNKDDRTVSFSASQKLAAAVAAAEGEGTQMPSKPSSAAHLPSQIPRRPKTITSSSKPSVPAAAEPAQPVSASSPIVPSSWERFSKPAAPSRRRSKRVSADLSLGGCRPPSRASEVGSEDGSEAGFQFDRGGRGGSLPPTPTFPPSATGGMVSGIVGGGRRHRKARQVSHSSVASIDSSASVPALFLPVDHRRLGALAALSPAAGERALSPGVDEQAFYAMPRSLSSPSGWSDDDGEGRGMSVLPPFERDMRVGHAQEISIGDDGAEGSGEVPEGGLRLQREPSTSAFSLNTMHDTLSTLQKSNTDLSRSVASLKAELDAKAADYEVQAAELLGKAEELRVELGVTRREEKELRGREAGCLRQIAVFETEIANLHKSLERSKTQYTALVKMHQEQMQTSEDLRNVIRERDLDAKAAKETIESLKTDSDKWARDQQFLEETHTRLLQDLDVARQAEVYLDAQKVENLALKETINRLRADLDELRTNVSNGSAGLSRTGSVRGKGVSEDGGTLGRSLEKELLRQLMSGKEDGTEPESSAGEEAAEDEGDNKGDESYIETFITTSRRRIHGQRSKDVPKVIVEHQPASDIRDFEDIGTQVLIESPKPAAAEISIQTDESTLAGLPAYSPREGEEDSAQSVIDTEDGTVVIVPEEVAEISALEERSWRSAMRRKSRSKVVQNIYNTFHYTRGQGPDTGDAATEGLLSLILRYGAFLSTLGIGIFVAGMHIGRAHPPHLTSFHHALAADFAAWNAYNDLARSQGSGIGFAQASFERGGWLGWLGAVGAGAANKLVRVPT